MGICWEPLRTSPLRPAELPDVRVATPVTSVASAGPQGPVTVTASDGEGQYDAVVMATHSDVTLRLLGSGAPEVGRRVGPIGL